MTIISTLILIGVTLLIIAFFAGYEIAFISMNRLNVELKKKQGQRSGIILSNFLEHPVKFLSSCLVGFNIALVVYGLLFSQLLSTSLWNPLKIDNEYLKLFFDTVCSSLVVLVFGEFLPKAIFRAKSDGIASALAPIANLFHNALSWLAYLFVGMAQWILKYLFNVRVKDNEKAFSHVDLEHFFQQTKASDEEGKELSTDLFENALSLPNVKIRECLVPRKEIEAIDINTSIEDAKQMFITTRLSKLIVYQGSIDNILGYIHQLDLFKRPADVRSILLPIVAVPESMAATALINKLAKEGKSIAWVVDEFGGTAGVVTMEDVLEEIFGEIEDEYDTDEFVEKQLSENEFIFSGRLEIDYLSEEYGLTFDDDDSETLSGYIIKQHHAIPKLKESIILHNYQFDILNVSDTRIEMVKLKVLK